MKKALALILVIGLLAGLSACGYDDQLAAIDETLSRIEAQLEAMQGGTPAEEPVTEETETETATEEASEKKVVDFTWNGQKEVWSILPTTTAEGLLMINDAMGEMIEAEGFTYVKKDANGDPSAQVQFVEDAIAAGNVGALMIAAMNVEQLEDVVLDALENGIAVAMLGAEPTDYGISGCVYTAYEITAMFAVQAAEDWVEKRVEEGGNVPTNADGKYEVACDIYTDIQDGVYRSNGMVGTVDSSDLFVRVSTTTSYLEGYSAAYDNTQDVLGANPDCHIFIFYEPQLAMGGADAIADYCEVNGLSVEDYCVIPCYAEDNTFKEIYEQAQGDHASTAIKGYATYGDPAEVDEETGETIIPPVLTGRHLGDILLSACGIEGYDWPYGETYYDTITAVNVYGYEATWVMGEENPAIGYKIPEYIG